MWGVLTGRTLKTFPLRKWLALHVTVWSFALTVIAMATGRDIPSNASNLLQILAPAIYGVYAASSAAETIKLNKKEEGG